MCEKPGGLREHLKRVRPMWLKGRERGAMMRAQRLQVYGKGSYRGREERGMGVGKS